MLALSTKQRRALQALLSHPNVVQAAGACSLSERQIYRYLAQPAFRAALASLESELLDAATRRLVGLQDAAIEVLAETVARSDATAAAKLRAAQLVLEHCLRLRELRDLDARLTQLEARLRR